MTKRPRHSLILRLTAIVALTLVAFTIVTSLTYNAFMRSETVEQHSRSMQRSAYVISQNLYDLIASSSYESLDDTRLSVSWDTLAPYLALTEQITRCNVYFVDTQHNITGYFDGVVQTLENRTLPGYLEQSIALGFMGKTPFISSGTREDTRLTACAPIMDEQSHVLGVVLLDASLRELGYTQVSGSAMLVVSLVIASAVALLVALTLAYAFMRPIERVRRAAISLASGAYETRLPVRTHDEIGQLSDAMNTLALRLAESRCRDEELHARQQEFFSNISHELRTPVTVIRGSLEALADGVVSAPEEISAYYRQMIAESRWLQKLIADLLELSRLQSPAFAIEQNELDLTELLGDVAMSAGTLCQSKGLRFLCEEPPHRYPVQGDYARLRQMLMAVVHNAVKFTPEGAAVSLSLCEQSDGRPVVIVADEGCGIPEADLAHIFDRFHHSRSRNSEGTGLGLALAQEIAKRHSIRIDVQSTEGKGTTFSFHF